MSSNIEDIIDEIEDFVENCKPSAFNSAKIVVNRDTLESLLDELRERTPQEIKQYQRIISNQEKIISDAKKKAEEMIAEAQMQTNELLSEHEIMQRAEQEANKVIEIASKQAEDILSKATEEANNIKTSAMVYTDDLLKNVQDVVYRSMETTRNKADTYLNTMQGYLDTVIANRMELRPQESAENAPEDTAAGDQKTGGKAAANKPEAKADNTSKTDTKADSQKTADAEGSDNSTSAK